MDKIYINTDFIKLNQAVKLASIISNGSDIKLLLEDNLVSVNDNIVNERGKKLRPKDIVKIKGYGSFIVELSDEN